MMLLASPFSYPLHVIGWRRPKGSPDYRVTNPYDGPDFVNGGKHEAVDVGNFRQNDTLRSPAQCRGMGLRHPDSSLGNRLDLGNGVTLDLWHLSTTLRTDRWTPLAPGQAIGTTGATGPRISDGKGGTVPMPAHTHIRAERHGVPFDIEPFLPMVERAAKPLPMEEEVITAVITEDWTTKAGPEDGWFLDSAGNRKHFTAPIRVTSIAELVMADGTVGRLIAYGAGEALVMPRTNIVPIPGTRVVGLRTVDCSPQEATIAQLTGKIDRARTANRGAAQAQQVVEGALA